jgi:glycosyltransferase involved in cell wall biosynthesis
LPRVTVVARGVHPPWNEGTRVIARNIARALEQANYRTNTISLSEKAYARYDSGAARPIKHVSSRLSYGIAPDYLYLKQMARAVNVLNPGGEASAIHLIGAPLALGPLIKGQRRKIVSHVTLSRQVYLSVGERLRAHLGWRLFDQWIDAYACTSEQIKADLLHRGYDPRKLRVIPPPIDVNCFKPLPRQEARIALGLDQTAFVVAYVGTISPLRFPMEEIVRALNLAAPEVPRLLLEIFAPVATHNRNRKWAEDNVGQQVRNADFTVNTHLKDLTENEKALIYSAVDVVLLPFTAPVAVEPPLTLLEAMSCGTPVLVAPYANRSRVVRHGANGLLFGSVEEMASHLKRLLEIGPEGRARIGSAGRQTVLRGYTFETVSESIGRLWTSIGL